MQDTEKGTESPPSVNEREAEKVRDATKGVSKRDQQSKRAAQKPANPAGNSEDALQDREARDRMADEGNPVPKP